MKLPFVILISLLFSPICLAAEMSQSKMHRYGAELFVAPDGSFKIEQSAPDSEDLLDWTTLIVSTTGMKPYALKRPDDNSHYAGFFHLSPDECWLLQSQKVGSGENTLYLYHRDKDGQFQAGCKDVFGDLVWKFFSKQKGTTTEMVPTFHLHIDFMSWEAGHFLRLKLSGINFLHHLRWVTDDWQCTYDLNSGEFSVPASEVEHNRKRIVAIAGKDGNLD